MSGFVRAVIGLLVLFCTLLGGLTLLRWVFSALLRGLF